MLLPDFAKSIVDARANGERPAMQVLVSDGDFGLHRRYPQNPVVRVRASHRPSAYEWRFLAGLDVEIFTRDHRRGVALARAIHAARPLNLCVTHPETMKSVRVVFYGVTMVYSETQWLSGNTR